MTEEQIFAEAIEMEPLLQDHCKMSDLARFAHKGVAKDALHGAHRGQRVRLDDNDRHVHLAGAAQDIGAGVVVGIIIYAVFFSAGQMMLYTSSVGFLLALIVGLLIGFSYYIFFKLTLRTFTWPFLRRAQALTTRPIAPLLPIWASSEIDKLEEMKTFLFRTRGQGIDWAYPISLEDTGHEMRCSTGERFNAA